MVRLRYALIVAVGGALAAELDLGAGSHPINDWLVFESAARIIVHYHHIPVYGGGALGLYARLPGIQIGPPAVLPVAAFQWLAPYTVNKMFVAVMMLLGIAAVAAAEIAARAVGSRTARQRISTAAMIGGCVVAVDWAWCVALWHHLDDAMALGLTAIACGVIARRGPWWLVGLLIGTAVAAKPWAIVMSPVVIGLDREARGKALLTGLLTATAWWAPFVVGAPSTISALGGYHITLANGSVPRLVGLHGDVQDWLRPVQFGGGVAAALLVARRGGRWWLAAPLAGLAVRVLTDPFVWPYYGMGPILFALMWDLARPGVRRVPLLTLVTAAVEGLLFRLVTAPTNGPPQPFAYLLASCKLAWGVGVLVLLAVQWRRHRVDSPPTVPSGTTA
jgi:hypothetical protein